MFQVAKSLRLVGPTAVWQLDVLWPGGRGRIYATGVAVTGSSAKIAVTSSLGDQLDDIAADGAFDFELPECTINFDASVSGSDDFQSSSIVVAALSRE